MTEQLVAVAAIEMQMLNQKISKLEAKNQVNEFLIRLLLQRTDLNKNIPMLEKVAEDIYKMSGSTDIYEEFQTRLLELQNSLHNMGNLQEKS